MFKSREVRWFFKDENKDIASWFRSRQLDFNYISPRTDYYHLPTLSSGLGIKIREGRLEIKHLVSGPYTGELYQDRPVSYEEWIKWSFEIRNNDPETRAIVQDLKQDNWLAVHKRRMAVKIGEEPSGALTVYKLDMGISRGCQLEYTELEVGGELYYSVGLEWFGEPWIDLNQKFLKEFLGATDLSEQTTSSYPSFLLDQSPMKG